VAPIPAALSTGPGYAANRAVTMVPVIQILMAIGLVYLLIVLKTVLSQKVLKTIFAIYVFASVALFGSFLEDYFIQSAQKAARGMVYGSLESAEWFVSNDLRSVDIVASRTLSQPHIYFAFARKLDPKVYQEATKTWKYEAWVDQIPEYSLDRYLFKDIKEYDLETGNVLVGRPEDFPDPITPTHTIYNVMGEPAVFIYDPARVSYAEAK